jgi:ABC-type Fe3+-siderophore transport system permease subunit
MIELILIIVSCVLIFTWRILDSIKSGSFYAASRGKKPNLLKRFMNNLHFVQTPLWYCVFGTIGLLLFAIFNLRNEEILWLNILSAFLISTGISSMCGPFYQGFINVGGGDPFVNENEKRKMEFANLLTGKTFWIKRPWYGKLRIYFAFIGLIEVIVGLIIIFNKWE